MNTASERRFSLKLSRIKYTLYLNIKWYILANKGDNMAVACGEHFSAVVTHSGHIFAWGKGDGAQLGVSTHEHKWFPSSINIPARFVLVAAGRLHAIAVAKDGALWVWGSNNYCQLGHADGQLSLKPTPLDKIAFGGATVVMADCGERHTVAITADGGVWTFGQNNVGQLGHGDTSHRKQPFRVMSQNFQESKIVKVAAGAFHNVAMCLQVSFNM